METDEKNALPLFGDEESSLERELAAERRQAFPMWGEREVHPQTVMAPADAANADSAPAEEEVPAAAPAPAPAADPITEMSFEEAEAAAEAEPPQEEAPERLFRTPMNRAPALKPTVSDAAGESFGEYLRRLREENHFTIDELSGETRIKREYLLALEREDLAALPSPVYVMGYVRKLCTLYRVPENRVEEVTQNLREQLEYELPDDINKSVVDREVNEEEERKVRQLTMIFAGAAILVIAALAIGGLLLIRTISGSQSKEVWQEPESRRILDLVPAPQLKNSRLSIPR